MTCYAGPMVLPAMQVFSPAMQVRRKGDEGDEGEREMKEMKEMKGPMVLSCIYYSQHLQREGDEGDEGTHGSFFYTIFSTSTEKGR
jgi:hypothetical protein